MEVLILSIKIYKMTTEFQTFFESQVLSFVVSCQPGAEEGGATKVHATRRALDRLASTTSLTRSLEPLTNLDMLSNEAAEEERSSEDEEVMSVEPSTRSVTPASEMSMRETRSMRRARNQSDEFGMTLRRREGRKRILEDSESEEEEEEGGMARRKPRTRTGGKRQRRVSSGSEGESVPLTLLAVTTSRGRTVKPTSKSRWDS